MDAQDHKTTQETIVSTIVALIGIAAEEAYRERILALPDAPPVEPRTDTVDPHEDAVLAQERQARAALVGKITEFRDSLKVRHKSLVEKGTPDKVLERYEKFFELKDA